MNKAVAGVIVAVLFIVGGWYLYQNQDGNIQDQESVQPQTTLVVEESIVGKWQDTTDPKFVREFKDGGVAADYYDNEMVSNGTFSVFTKEKPLEVLFPIEANAVYVQLVMSGSQSEKLNFKLVKLTPDELQLVYMDRGGVLAFRSLK